MQFVVTTINPAVDRE